jgi:hypothetical protein
MPLNILEYSICIVHEFFIWLEKQSANMQNLLLGLQCMSVVLNALYASALLKSFLCVKRDSVTRIFFL